MATLYDFLPGIDTEITPFVRGVQVTKPTYIRDRFNNLLPADPGDWVVQLGDGSLTVFTNRSVTATDSDYDGNTGPGPLA